MEQEATIDQMEQEIVDLELHIGRVRARQMTLLAELDRFQVPLGDGCRSMVEWTASRLDVAPETATALVRASRTVMDTPAVSEALAAGEVTFDRAVELCRYAATGITDPFGAARRFDIAGLRREVSRAHRLTRDQEHQTACDRYLAMQPNLDLTAWRLWGLLPGVDGAIVEAALTRRGDTLPALPDGTRGSRGQRHADALTAVCQDSLTGTAGQTDSTPLLTVFIDAEEASRTNNETGVTLDSGTRIGPSALDELLCDTRIETILTSSGTPLAVGRRIRTVSPALRRAILHRDGAACTADGCTSRYRLQPHHIVPYSQGGRTDPDNLTTLCWYHHHVVIHGMGYTIDHDSPPARLRFRKPHGGPDPP
ncbi:HNH endonuclease [bacterium BMS3Abin02]|nr:HNH endonuclease [bacterium BMS3Abin02]HDL49495.1 HNH endonuclease [Actinomycetota bacterium]